MTNLSNPFRRLCKVCGGELPNRKRYGHGG